MSVTVLIEEEYGYRHWLWEPNMTVAELKEWWKALPTVTPYFFDGPISFPGDVVQIHLYDPEPGVEPDPSKGDYLISSDDGKSFAQLILPAYKDPEDDWYIHLHQDNDSHLMAPDGEDIFHAGWVSDDEYYSDDYECSAESEEAYNVAMTEQLKKFLKRCEDVSRT